MARDRERLATAVAAAERFASLARLEAAQAEAALPDARRKATDLGRRAEALRPQLLELDARLEACRNGQRFEEEVFAKARETCRVEAKGGPPPDACTALERPRDDRCAGLEVDRTELSLVTRQAMAAAARVHTLEDVVARVGDAARIASAARARPNDLRFCAEPGMLPIPTGTFEFGDIAPRSVTVTGFCLDAREVAAAAFAACVEAGKCSAPGGEGDCNADRFERLGHPANCVDASQARAYCAMRGLRLPTEEEWEYAARGTDGRVFPWGNEEPKEQLCWGFTTRGTTCATGAFSRASSPFGILDLAGNVWEWTDSPFSAGAVELATRGGSWKNELPQNVRSASRVARAPSHRGPTLGFRCAGPVSP